MGKDQIGLSRKEANLILTNSMLIYSILRNLELRKIHNLSN